jgi:hypothetical protein
MKHKETMKNRQSSVFNFVCRVEVVKTELDVRQEQTTTDEAEHP